jgi:pimeloyl-ACP methyl ester carboxylesterase
VQRIEVVANPISSPVFATTGDGRRRDEFPFWEQSAPVTLLRRREDSKMPTDVTAGSVRSADGTTIAFERSGTGPALIMVDCAGAYRELNSLRPLAALLAADFTVFTYDRRGRGESTDTLPYAVEREVDDLAALIAEAGGSAFVYAWSSGAPLALHAVASGLAIGKLAFFEPAIDTEKDAPGESKFTLELAELVAAGRRWDAVDYFLRGTGVPPEYIDQMTPPSRRALEAIAHTLVYDCVISDATSLELVRSVTVPTLVAASAGTTGELPGWAATVVEALPNGAHRSLAGEWHGVPVEDLAPVVTEFLTPG